MGVEFATRFEFATATRITFGAGALENVGKLAANLGKRALVVTGQDPSRAARLFELLTENDVATIPVAIEHEPYVADAAELSQRARDTHCDMVISFGGGSAIDLGKAVAALSVHGGDPLDYLEVIGSGKPLTNTPLPFIAIPTTAGTGAEVTSNAVLASPEHQVKVSLRSPLMLPRAAIVDPALTYDLSPEITARTGMDALTQVIEPYVSNKHNPLTDSLCREGMVRAARSLHTAYRDGANTAAREDMAIASLFGGLALANAKLGAVHGFAGPIGGMFNAPHGAICAALLPHVMRANIYALRERDARSEPLRRYDEIAHLITGDSHVRADDGAEWVADLTKSLGIPQLRTYGITPDDFDTIAGKSAKASSMQGNPITLTQAELIGILEAAY